MPIHYVENPVREYALPKFDSGGGAACSEGFHFPPQRISIRLILGGRSLPVEVAERVIAAIEDSNQQDPPLRAVIESDAGGDPAAG